MDVFDMSKAFPKSATTLQMRFTINLLKGVKMYVDL